MKPDDGQGRLGCRILYETNIIPEIKVKENLRIGLNITIAVVSTAVVW
jgi:hypothetical protein